MSLLAPAFTYQRRPNVDAQGNPLPSDDPTSDFPQDMTPTGADTPPPPPVSMPPALGPPPADPSAVPPPVQAGGPQSDEETAAEIAQMHAIPPEVNVQPKPTMRDRWLGHSNPTPPPVSVAANGAQQMPNAPAPRTPGILQRIAAAGLGAATGYVNAARRTQIDPDTIARGEQGILHPGYGAQMGAYNRTVQQIQGQADLNSKAAKEKAELENAASNEELRGATADQRKADAATRATGVKEKATAASAKLAEDLYAKQTKGRSVFRPQPGETPPPGWRPIKAPDGVTEYASPAILSVPKELVEFLPGYKEGDQIDSTHFDAAAKTYQETLKATKIQDNKPDPATKAKDLQQTIIAKVAAEGNLSKDAFTNVGTLSQAIRNAKTISPEEKNSALAYLATNTTPAAQGSAATIRVEGMNTARENAVINKKTGELEYRNSADINAHPGLYAPAAPGAKAMTQQAVFSDLHFNINTARAALNAISDMDPATRAHVSSALRHSDPKSAVATFLSGAIGTNMTPEQQELVQSLAQLQENAMTLRGIAGMGQGSDDLRSAILNTIPSGKSPTKQYALGQLAKFEQIVNRLEQAAPKMGDLGKTDAAQKPAVDPKLKSYADQYFGGDLDKAQAAIAAQRQQGGRGK